ncbi:hypothetical protein OJF2_76530 [Aquisphaera giovannonii]|uniref:Uncharacterized protein n=1 Tax=Aquisphaera giovannonii TaxID=406548 RepID=A0A5B9WGA4_9BACT|nr:hypothetical protein [Aquisphaera giovannonii]QEH39041.1 hypothetical protein OJF2_76530 [Aquisphaera giovannonii]
MGRPLFDHELDDYPSAPHAAGGLGERSRGAGDNAFPHCRDGGGHLLRDISLFYAALSLGLLLIPIATLAPQSPVGRFVNRPDPAIKAGLAFWRGYLRLLAISQLGLWLIPIAALRPRALDNRAFARWAGMGLCFDCGFFLLALLSTASELAPIVAAWPYLCAACLVGLGLLGADYLRRCVARLRWLYSGAEGKGASSLTQAMITLGFEGGSIPPTLRVFVVWGIIGGAIGTLTSALQLASDFRQGPGDEETRVVVVGEGIVRGAISHVSGGPYSYGTDGRAGHGYSSGGSMGQDPGEPSWVHFRRGGFVDGEELTAEVIGREFALQGRAAIRAWRLANVAFCLCFVLLVIASVAAAWGSPIGVVLYAAWAMIVLTLRALWTAWVPETAGPEDLVLALYPMAALAVLSQPAVRSYLGRPRGGAVAGKPSGPAMMEL